MNYTLSQLFYRFCKEEGFYDKGELLPPKGRGLLAILH